MHNLPKLQVKIRSEIQPDRFSVELIYEGADLGFDEGPVPIELGEALRVRLRQHLSDGQPEAAGRALGEAVFSSDQLRQAISRAIGATLQLRVVLDLVGEQLQDLPWELLAFPNTPEVILGASTRFPLSRYLRISADRAWPIRPLPARPHVLVVVAQPAGYPAFQHQSFYQAIADGLGKFSTPHLLQGPDTLRQITEHLQRTEADFVFFIAYGERAPHEPPVLAFEDGAGHVIRTPAHELADVFRGLAAPPHFVGLISCYGATDDRDGNRSLAWSLASAGVPIVLGMQEKITHETALIVLTLLCEQLGNHQAPDIAVTSARAVARQHADWWYPIVYTRFPGQTPGRVGSQTTEGVDTIGLPVTQHFGPALGEVLTELARLSETAFQQLGQIFPGFSIQHDQLALKDARIALVRHCANSPTTARRLKYELGIDSQRPNYNWLNEDAFDLRELYKDCLRKWRNTEGALVVIKVKTHHSDFIEYLARRFVNKLDRTAAPFHEIAPRRISYKYATSELERIEKRVTRQRDLPIVYAVMVVDDSGWSAFQTFLKQLAGMGGNQRHCTLLVGLAPDVTGLPEHTDVISAPERFSREDVGEWLDDVQRLANIPPRLIAAWEQLFIQECMSIDANDEFEVEHVYHHLRDLARYARSQDDPNDLSWLSAFIAERLP